MKTTFFALAGIFVFAFSLLSLYAQSPSGESNYVIIGAFAIEKNAQRLTASARKQHLDSKFVMNESRNLYYVYVLSTADKAEAITEANRLRSETQYTDTWVYHGGFEKPTTPKNVVDLNPVTEEKIVVADPPVQEKAVDAPVLETPAEPKVTAEGKNFVFKIYRGVDNKSLDGEVEVIEPDKAKRIGIYEGNKSVVIPNPKNKSGEVLLSCESFGYRKSQRTINYQSPEAGTFEVDQDGNTVIPLELVKLQKGDIAVMYNVFFFKDGAIMRPESRYEVDKLLQMLQENPERKIRIHGHTNGNAHGKILSIGESNNFFSLTGAKDGYGSSKKLSEERAKVIKSYLVSNGIAAERMEIKAWGGKRPIHDKEHTRAAENVRVEVEILSD